MKFSSSAIQRGQSPNNDLEISRKPSCYADQAVSMRLKFRNNKNEGIYDFFVWYDSQYSSYFLCSAGHDISEFLSSQAIDMVKFVGFQLEPYRQEIDKSRSEISIYTPVDLSQPRGILPLTPPLFSNNQLERGSMGGYPPTLIDEIKVDCDVFEKSLLESKNLDVRLFLKILLNMMKIGGAP